MTKQQAPRPDFTRPKKDVPQHVVLLAQSEADAAPFRPHCNAVKGLHVTDAIIDADVRVASIVEQTISPLLASTTSPILVLDLLSHRSNSNGDQDPVEATIQATKLRCAVAQALSPSQQRIQWLGVVPSTGWSNPTPASNTHHDALLAGAAAGAIKSLGQEWEIWHRVAYLSHISVPSGWLADELYDSSHHPEVLYLRADDAEEERRWLPVLTQPTQTPQPRQLPERPFLLITGGGMGITATIAKAMAQQIGPFKALILGRTKPPTQEEYQQLKDPKKARSWVRGKLGDNAKPRDVQAALQREQRRIALADSLASLSASGIEVMYRSADVQDAEAVAAAVAEASQQWGQIAGVIHGAGVDKSRNLADKTPAEIDLVLGVKLRGMKNIITAVQLHNAPGSILFWLGFGSVSARLGNRGQFDYAAANEALARWLTGSFADGMIVDYTAWDEIGMAAPLAKIMKERGVDMLPPGLASHHTAKLVIDGHTGEWVFSGRLLSAQQDDPLLGTPALVIPGTLMTTSRQLQTDQYQYLRDHQIQGAEIMPGVVSFFTMHRAAKTVGWDASIRHCTDIQFSKAIKLWPNHPLSWTLETERLDGRSGPTIATVIHSERERKGQLEHTNHAAATFRPGLTPDDDARETLTRQLAGSALTIDADAVYNTFFHGPCWQVVEHADIAEDGVLATSPMCTPMAALGMDLPEDVRWNAVGLELILQAAGLWVQHVPERFALPFGIERWYALDELQECPRGTMTAHVIPQSHRGDLYIFDGGLFGPDGTLLQQVTGLQMRIFPI